MMIEEEKLQYAQHYIARELLKQAADRVEELSWDQGPWDPAAGIYRLTISRNGEKSIFSFTKFELFKNHGSEQWRKELRDHVDDILMELQDG